MTNSELILPGELILGLEEIPAISCFEDEKNNILTDNEISNQVIFNEGIYQSIPKGCKVKIRGNKDAKLEVILSVMVSQMKKELQFGNVLSHPNISENFENLVMNTLSENDSFELINKLSEYKGDLVKRSIHACGVGIALSIFSDYGIETIKAIGLGGLLHDFGYTIDTKTHTTKGANYLEMNFFTQQGKYTNIVLNILSEHHKTTPHQNPAVNCGKISIHWCTTPNLSMRKKMQQIIARKNMYSIEIFNKFSKLYEIMSSRESN